MQIAFQLYEKMPCYAVLMYIYHNYDNFEKDEKVFFWSKYRQYINCNNQSLSKPVEYSLWCDYFENPQIVNEAWHSMLSEPFSDLLVQRILLASGPVPYMLKSVLFQKLIMNEKWHIYIFKSISGSAFEYYGNIEKEDAKIEYDSEFKMVNQKQYFSITVDDYEHYKEDHSDIINEYPIIKKEGVYYLQYIDNKKTDLSKVDWRLIQKDIDEQIVPDSEWKDCSEFSVNGGR